MPEQIFKNPEIIKPPQEQLADKVKELSTMKERHESGHILGEDFRDYFLALGRQYQVLISDQRFIEQNREEIGVIINSMTEGINQLNACRAELDAAVITSPGQQRRLEAPHFEKLRKSMDTINEEIFKQLTKTYNIKSDKKFTPADLSEVEQDKHYRLLQEIGKFLTQAQVEISAEPESKEQLESELTIAAKVLFQPGVHAHDLATGQKISVTVNRRTVERRLFKDAPDKIHLTDYLPMWLRGLPYFTDRKIQ